MLHEEQCGAARQLGKCADAELGAAAVGAEQTPLHGEQTRLHACEASLDRRPRWNAKIDSKHLGFEMGDVGGHAAKHDVGEPRAEAIAVRAAVDFAGQRRCPLARAGWQLGRRQLERRKALARTLPTRKGDGLQGALPNRLTRLGREPCAECAADQAQRLPFECVGDVRAALAVRLDIEHRAEAAKRALREHARLAEVPTRDPLVRLLLPFEREASGLASPATNDGPVWLQSWFERVRRQAHGLVEPFGIRQHRPEPVRWQVERPGPSATHRLEL